MARINLKAELREQLGKSAAKRLRRQGFIPAVVYKGKDSLHIKISSRDFSEVIHTRAGENVVVNLQVAGDTRGKEKAPLAHKLRKSGRTSIIKEIQYHPIKGEILHVDFNEISLTEVLAVKVPVVVKGEAQGVKEGGILEHVLWEVEVECLPTQIPENIPVDVSALKIGEAILVKDLVIPKEVKVLTDPEATVITLAAPHVEVVEEAKPEEERLEPEVITEKKPEEEAPAEEAKEKELGKEKK